MGLAGGNLAIPIDRRQFLEFGAGLIALAAGRGAEAADSGLRFGPPQPFSYEALRDLARARAGKPYAPPSRPAPVVQSIDFDAIQKIKFRPDCALFKDDPLPVRASTSPLSGSGPALYAQKA